MVVILINLARVVFEMRPFETNSGSRIGSHKFAHGIKNTSMGAGVGLVPMNIRFHFFCRAIFQKEIN